MKLIIIAALLSACATTGTDDEECVFDGAYEFGMLPDNGCESSSFVQQFNGESDECYWAHEDVNFEGVRYFAIVSCEPGSPVVECSGTSVYANGCEYTSYIRRIVR